MPPWVTKEEMGTLLLDSEMPVPIPLNRTVIDNEKSWSLRADARRRIILYYETQVSLQETGSEPLGLGPSFSVENRN